MKLDNKKANEAWDDYKAFKESMGQIIDKARPEVKREIEMAFKLGFQYGAKSKPEPIIREPIDFNMRHTVPPFAANSQPAENHEKAFNNIKKTVRKKGEIHRRTYAEVKRDAQLVKTVLQRRGEPMRLLDVYNEVNKAGANWNYKSATGYINSAMRMIPKIKKVGHGLYEYQG